MTETELQALISLLSRTPMTPAETVWVNDLLRRLRPQPKPEPERETHD